MAAEGEAHLLEPKIEAKEDAELPTELQDADLNEKVDQIPKSELIEDAEQPEKDKPIEDAGQEQEQVDGDQDEDDEDEEDDVKVTIEDFKVQRQPQQAKPATIDFEASQQAILELDLNSLEDKPWRKPGAAVSDYFNYGFDEETWKLYCEKQRKIKAICVELSSVQETYQIPVVIPDVAPVVLPPPRMDIDEQPTNEKRSHHPARKERGVRLSPPKESSSRSRRSRSRDHASRRSRSREKGSSSRRRSRSKEASSSSKKRRPSRSRSPHDDRRSKRHKSSRSSRR